MFLKPNHEFDCYTSVRIHGLPEDYKILGEPYYDPCWHAFTFIIEHPSFDEVSFGDIAPIHDQTINMSFELSYEYVIKSMHDAWIMSYLDYHKPSAESMRDVIAKSSSASEMKN